MFLQPSSSTLFPYTTLFRSGPILLGDDGHPPAWRHLQGEGQAGDATSQDQKIELFHKSEAGIVNQPRPAHKDRKSTRLNSSHRTISYAVFCLKKKKKKKKINKTKKKKKRKQKNKKIKKNINKRIKNNRDSKIIK